MEKCSDGNGPSTFTLFEFFAKQGFPCEGVVTRCWHWAKRNNRWSHFDVRLHSNTTNVNTCDQTRTIIRHILVNSTEGHSPQHNLLNLYYWLITIYTCSYVAECFSSVSHVLGSSNVFDTVDGRYPARADRWFIPLFPTCQVRVVRFYQGALPPPPPPPSRPPPPPPPRLAVLFLLVLLLASSSSFSSTMSASTSTCTSALPTLRQALCQLSSPTLCAKLFANFPAQCALLDLNLRPSQLSVHRWTSTAR